MSQLFSRPALSAFVLALALLAPPALTATRGQTPAPSPSPSPQQDAQEPAPVPSQTPQSALTPETDAAKPSLRNTLFNAERARPVPPVPSLVRLGVITEETMPLTLDDAIRRALENNNDIEVERNNVRISETTLRSLEGVYQPLFAVTPQYISRTLPATRTFEGAGGSSISTNSFAVSPSVSKLFRTGGGRYDFFFNNTRSTATGGASAFSPSFDSELGVQFTQPLLRDRSIDGFRRDIRVQRKRLEQSDADFRRRVIEIIASVQNSYWELVFALRDQQNRILNLNLARENFRLTEARVAAGALAPLARAEVQTELSTRETELLLASQNVSQAENNLKGLFLGDPSSPLWSAQILPTDEPTIDDTPVSLDSALAEARQNRPELRRLRLQQDINDIDTQFLRNQTRPRIDLQSTISTGGFAGTPFNFGGIGGGVTTPLPIIDTTAGTTNSSAFLLNQLNLLRTNAGLLPLTGADIPTITPTGVGATPDNIQGGYFRSFRNLFTFDQRTIIVGVRIEFPFRNRTAEANLAGARIQRTQLDAQTRQQEQTVQTEVRNSAQQVETARRRVQTARQARESAELQLEGERQLFQAGRSTQFLLFQRENALAAARNLELRAQTDYNQALALLQRATSTTLQVNNIIIKAQ